MSSLGHDLFLLMLSLSRLRDRPQMIRRFVEALSDARPGVVVRALGPGEESRGEIVQLATPGERFGRIAVEGTLAPEDRALFRDAILMLAVVLESVSREERISAENARVDLAGASRTAEFQATLAEIHDLYANSTCGYHTLAEDGTILRMNETELRWLGYPRAELVGKKKYQDLLTPESAEAFASVFTASGARGTVRDLELELVRRDGTILSVLLGATANRSATGALLSSRATVIDLTERRTAEEQLRQAQKLEGIGRLAGGVAHDFNNILTVILSANGALLEGLAGQPLREEALEIESAAKRAATLTRQLLTFSRRQRTEPRVLDPGELVAQLDKMLRRLVAENVELRTVARPGVWRIRADPGQIEQVVVNLVVNACDAMPSGGQLTLATANVQVDAEGARSLGLPAGDHVMISVADTGSGMEASVVSHLFEPFFTTKIPGRGTGLGLSTVYGIVKGCGGEIRVDTAPGKGTTFRIYLPAVEDRASSSEGDRVEALARGSERVLLVEDEPAVRRLALRALRDAGYEVLEAGDGEEALRLAGPDARIDVLVTDVVMPRVGGAELADRIRARRPGVKVLLVSGYAQDGQSRGVAPGPDTAFLTKPFTPAALSRRVRDLLDAPPTLADAVRRPEAQQDPLSSE